jgi:ribonucleoside-diphosphate reductase alpha chain
VNQYGAFNSPVWFNVGLYHEYGIGKNSDKGNWSSIARPEKLPRAFDAVRIPAMQRVFHSIGG